MKSSAMPRFGHSCAELEMFIYSAYTSNYTQHRTHSLNKGPLNCLVLITP